MKYESTENDSGDSKPQQKPQEGGVAFRAWFVSIDGEETRVSAKTALGAILRAGEVLGKTPLEAQNIRVVEFGLVWV
jgi:hypothetical protein